MAEVMLRFKNAAGTKLVASRRLQVTKKKNAGITMKTLEGTLSYNDEGREGAGGKVRGFPVGPLLELADIGRLSVFAETNHFHQMCRDGRRASAPIGHFESHLRECDFLSSRG